MKIKKIAVLAGFVAVLTTGLNCGGDGITGPGEKAAVLQTITLSQDTASLIPGATLQISASLKSSAGEPMSQNVAWASSDNAVATVNGTGVVTAVTKGTVSITASAGTVSAKAVLRVVDGAAVPSTGGVVSASSGTVQIQIPAGALPASTNISIAPAAAPPIDPRVVPNTSFDFGPAGTVFSSPTRVTVKYDPAKLPAGTNESALQLYLAVGNSWELVEGSTADIQEKTVTGSVRHFSTYGVLLPAPAAGVSMNSGSPGKPITNEKVTVSAGETVQLVANAVDNRGAALSGRTITWTSADPSVASVTASGLVRGMRVGSSLITASSENKSTAVNILVEPGSGAALKLSSSPSTVVQNRAVFASQPAIQIVDAFGNNALTSGVSVTAAVASGGNLLGTSTAVTDAAGLATFTNLAFAGLTGERSIAFSAPGMSSVAANVSVTAGSAQALKMNAGNAQTAIAGTAVAVTPSVTVTDADGNPVQNHPVSFAVASGGGTVTGPATNSSASGIAAVGSWTLGPVAGVNSLTASAPGVAGGPITFTATGTSGAPVKLAITSPPPTSIVSRTAFSSSPVVQLKDALGNNVGTAGVAVSVALSSGPGTLSGPLQATTNSEGEATFSGLSIAGKVGGKVLTFTAAGLPSVSSEVSLTAGPPVSIVVNAGDNQSAAAGSAVAFPPSVRVVDADENPIAGAAVTFAVSGGGGVVTGATSVTNADGIAAVGSWTLGTLVGANSLSATTDRIPGATVRFSATATAGAPGKLVLITPPSATAASRTAFLVQPVVQLQDALGNVVATPGTQVTAAITSGGGALLGISTATTSASGIATFTNLSVAGTVGTRTLTFSAAGVNAVSASVDVTAGAASNVIANDGENQTAIAGLPVSVAPSVRVTDADENRISGVAVSFAVASGGGTASGAQINTDALGVARVGNWTLGTVAGANTLTATVNGLNGSLVTFAGTGVAGAATQMAFNGGSSTGSLGSAVAVPPSVIVKDANGNATAGVSITFSVAAGGGSVTGATQVTNSAGVATVGSWTLGTVAGINVLQASGENLIGSPLSFSVTTVSAGATQIAANGGSNTGVAGTAVATPPSVITKDANGNPVGGVSITFAVAGGGGSVTGATQVTNSSGIATVGSWTLGTSPGPNSLTATASGLSGSPVTFTATGTIGSPATIVVAGGSTTGTTGAAVATPPTVIVKDVGGNAVSGATVTFTVTSGGGAVTGATQTTNASGLATLGGWTLGVTPGSQVVTATSGVATTAITVTASLPNGCSVAAYEIGATVPGTWASGDCANATAHAASGALYDQYELSLSTAKNIRFELTAADGRSLRVRKKNTSEYVGLPLGASFTTVTNGALIQRHFLGAGNYIVEVQAPASTTGSYSLTSAVDNTDIVCRPVVQGSIGMTYAGSLDPVTDCDSEDWIVLPLTTGDKFRITVTTTTMKPGFVLRDDRLGPSSPTMVMRSASAPGTITLDWVASFDTYHELVIFKNGGTSDVFGSYTVTIERLTDSGNAPTQIAANGGSTTATAGSNVAVAPSVIVKDASGNPVAGVYVKFSITGGGGSATGTVVRTDASGIATVGSWKLGNSAGTNTMTAAASLGSLTGSPVTFTATATPGAGTMTLTGGSTTGVAGQAVATPPSVTIKDNLNNALSGRTVTFAVTGGGGSITGGTATTNALGVATVGSWILGTTAGTNALTATSTDVSGSPLTITATGTAGAAASIAANGGSTYGSAGAAVSSPPSVIVKDANGNVVSGVSVTFTVATGGGSITGATTSTNSSGIATVGSWTLGTVAGSNTLTATATGLSGSPVTFTSTGLTFSDISAGQTHSCGLTNYGAAFCWGRNNLGQNGDGTTTESHSPVLVAGGVAFASIVVGNQHSCGLTSAGTLYCWGNNAYGQLGDGTTTNRSSPTAVAGGLSFLSLSAGPDHTCALTSTSAYCWGRNAYGQLGDGTATDRLVPTAVSGGIVFQRIAAGHNHTCALNPGGAAYCWGLNAEGEIGDGTKTQRLAPTAVGGGNVFQSIAAEFSRTCAVATSGAAYCWGWNYYGQLGDGTKTSRLSPTAVNGGISFQRIAAGQTHTCAVASSGAAYCWGSNIFGTLGDGTGNESLSPVAVTGGVTFQKITAGNSHSCGTTSGGAAYCWGNNANGQLGDGTTIQRRAPMVVLLRSN